MKALVYHGPGKMRWEDWPEPEIAPGEVLVAVRAVGICGSDVHGFTGESGRRVPPLVMGHEAAGEIVAVGGGISQEHIGEQVVVFPTLTCGVCDQCTTGFEYRCRNRRFLGVNLNGAMAERFGVPMDNLLPFSESLSFEHAALTEPLAVAIHAAHRAGDLDGRSVLIVGSGPIGLLTMVAAKQLGAAKVVMTDLDSHRLEAAKHMGADAALQPVGDAWKEELADVVGGKEVDAAFDAVGIGPTFEQALLSVRPGGTVVALGGWQTVLVNLAPLVAREINVHGTFNFTRQEFQEALAWIEEARFDPSLLVLDCLPLHDGERVFNALSNHRLESAIKVVLTHFDSSRES